MPAETTAIVHDADLGADAFSFHLQGRAFAPHFHAAWVVGCVLSGRRRLMVQGREYLAAAGHVVILRPGDVHACAPAERAPFVWRGFHFQPESPLAAQLDILGDAPAAGPVLPAGGSMEELLRAHALMGGRAPLGEKRARLVAALRRLTRDACPAGGAAPALPRQGLAGPLEALRQHLLAHAGERFSLDDMAGIARMDKFRLVRAFGRLTGATPYRYLESARVNRAQELLAQGLPLAEVAMEAGFTDQSHLARAFRTRLGVTPGACRRRP